MSRVRGAISTAENVLFARPLNPIYRAPTLKEIERSAMKALRFFPIFFNRAELNWRDDGAIGAIDCQNASPAWQFVVPTAR